jgi:hypothetical protein
MKLCANSKSRINLNKGYYHKTTEEVEASE